MTSLSHRRLLLLLGSLLLQLLAISQPAASIEQQSQTSQSQCSSLCATCQSLKPTRINQICSAGLLTGCNCPEYALNLTEARLASDDTKTRNNCPQLDAMGFCLHGQQTDSAGCPIALCRPPSGCSLTAALTASPGQPPMTQTVGSGCQLFCPRGYQTDPSTGCPLCRCRCEPPEQARARCAEACAALGLAGFELAPGKQQPGECAVCVCRQEPAAANLPPPPPPCLLRCPNSCGPHGYADGESRDDRGCVRDCSCRCPGLGRPPCPTGETCLRWEIDRFGCQICSACSGAQTRQQQTIAGSSCITRSSLQLPNAMDRLCPANCPQKQFSISEDAVTGCLSCTCAAAAAAAGGSGSGVSNRCSQPEPVCSNSCGPHGHRRDSRGCLLPGCACDCPDLAACLASCANFTVAMDNYGCRVCQCSSGSSSSSVRGQIGNICPNEPWCFRDCGHHGYERDEFTNCRTSCECRCPKRSCNCFFGSRLDKFGCDSCECTLLSEARLPF